MPLCDMIEGAVLTHCLNIWWDSWQCWLSPFILYWSHWWALDLPSYLKHQLCQLTGSLNYSSEHKGHLAGTFGVLHLLHKEALECLGGEWLYLWGQRKAVGKPSLPPMLKELDQILKIHGKKRGGKRSCSSKHLVQEAQNRSWDSLPHPKAWATSQSPVATQKR